jgi:hypothetical protein
MARLRRRGRILKWAGLVGSLLIALAWIGTLGWIAAYQVGYSHNIMLQGGTLWMIPIANGATVVEWHPSLNLTWWWWSRPFGPIPGTICIPLWIPFLLVVIPTMALWRMDRRVVPPGHCRNCGYNLTGNVSGVCPECGEKASP